MEIASDRPRELRMEKGLDERLVRDELDRVGRLTDAGHRVRAFYLHEMQTRALYQSTGHVSASHYAQSRLGLTRRTARDYVAVGAELDLLPRLDSAFCEGRLCWTKLRMLARIAAPETEAEWLERALALSCAELERAIAGVAKGERPRKDKLGVPKVRFTLKTDLDALTYAEWESVRDALAKDSGETVTDADVARRLLRIARTVETGSFAGAERAASDRPRAEIVLHRCPDCAGTALKTTDGPLPLDALTAEMILCDAVSDETPEWLRRKILARDGHKCCHCGRSGELHGHHIDFRSKGGRTEPRNLMALCRRCHGLVHDGFLVITGEAPHALSFTDKEGRPIDAVEGPGEAGVRIVQTEPSGAQAPLATTEVVDIKDFPNPAPHGFARERGGHWSFSAASKSLVIAGPSTPVPKTSLPSPPGGRPKTFADFIGQKRVVNAIRSMVEGAKRAGKPVEHALLTGEAGLGKSALALAVAHATGTRAHLVSAPFAGDAEPLIRALLFDIEPGSVLFVDEIHALPEAAALALYEALQDRRITLNVRQGTALRSQTFELPPFTLVAATNEPDRLPQALLSRFGIVERFEPYSAPELAAIAQRTAREEERREFSLEAALALGRAARGNAREATHLARRVIRTVDGTWKGGALDAANVAAALRVLAIDERGLDSGDQAILAALREAKRPIGLSTLSARTGIRAGTILARHEPFLIRLRLVEVTPYGRVAC